MNNQDLEKVFNALLDQHYKELNEEIKNEKLRDDAKDIVLEQKKCFKEE